MCISFHKRRINAIFPQGMTTPKEIKYKLNVYGRLISLQPFTIITLPNFQNFKAYGCMCTYKIQQFSSELIGINSKSQFKFHKHLLLLALIHRCISCFGCKSLNMAEAYPNTLQSLIPKRGAEHPWLGRLQVKWKSSWQYKNWTLKLAFWHLVLTFYHTNKSAKPIHGQHLPLLFILEVSNRISPKAPVVFLRKFTDYFPGTYSLIF